MEVRMRTLWKEGHIYARPRNGTQQKTYILTELPYPSGSLHTGHWYAFSLADTFARYRRMQGDAIMFPIGFDSFGLPAENAAIQRNTDPAEWTEKNIQEMEQGFDEMGLSLDPSQRIRTSDPSFYMWTQWIFTQFFEKGLAYRKEAPTNWCQSCKTVIANEQVVRNESDTEICERCKTPIQQRVFLQWFLGITRYADALIDDLDSLDWPLAIKQQQKTWIGKSEGAYISFLLNDAPYYVFTTRPETLFGVSFLAVSPEHKAIDSIVEHATNKEEIYAYIQKAKAMETYVRSDMSREKTGVEIRGVVCIHPATKKAIPVYVADYVLAETGTGMLMGVPAHDERDYAFACTHTLPVLPVIACDSVPYSGEGVLVHSMEYDGLHSQEAGVSITKAYGEPATTYKLRDWSISRQRYWGCPIPIVYDPEGNPHAIPKEHLPWILPKDVDYTPTGEPPLARSKELLERTERIFGEGWTPEVETFDTFVDSSWYFIRYLDPENADAFCSEEHIKAWLPVDRYYGGAEHTTLHLLYSRFFYKAMHDLNLVTGNEPYMWRLNRGIILAPDGKKISKSLGNDIHIAEYIERYGVDVFRMSLAFLGPFDGPYNYPYNPSSLIGIRKFLERVYAMKDTLTEESSEKTKECVRHTIQNVHSSFERHKFNTAISGLMECVRDVRNMDIAQKEYEYMLLLLAPLAPFFTDDIWHALGHKESIHLQKQPLVKKEVNSMCTVVVQVQGKKKGVISIAKDAQQEDVVLRAKKEIPFVASVVAKTIIYIPGKILNFVV